MTDMVHLRRDAVRTIAKHVRAEAETRLAEIGNGQGCEASAARAFEMGRLYAVDVDAWKALGLYPDRPPAEVPRL